MNVGHDCRCEVCQREMSREFAILLDALKEIASEGEPAEWTDEPCSARRAREAIKAVEELNR